MLVLRHVIYKNLKAHMGRMCNADCDTSLNQFELQRHLSFKQLQLLWCCTRYSCWAHSAYVYCELCINMKLLSILGLEADKSLGMKDEQ